MCIRKDLYEKIKWVYDMTEESANAKISFTHDELVALLTLLE